MKELAKEERGQVEQMTARQQGLLVWADAKLLTPEIQEQIPQCMQTVSECCQMLAPCHVQRL